MATNMTEEYLLYNIQASTVQLAGKTTDTHQQ